MLEKTVVVISSYVDATIREYSPDTEFLIFKLPIELGKYLDENPIRATTMFVSEEVLGQTNTTLAYLHDLLTDNAYLSVDKVVFVAIEGSTQHKAIKYLVEQYNITNWELILGNLSKSYITEVINGTYRTEAVSVKRKAVYRIPRRDYVSQELKHRETLSEEYVDDENDLKDIPDEVVPEQEIPETVAKLKKYYIAGDDCEERSAFAFMAAQYLALSGKTLIIESDVDYHTITEYATKSGVDCYLITILEIMNDLPKAISNIIKSDKNLIVVGTIDRVDFSYQFMSELLYYNLIDSVDNMVCEVNFNNLPAQTEFTVTVPSTMKGILTVGCELDKLYLPYARFVGVNLNQLPQIHLNSGVVMTGILRDLLVTNDVVCPVVTLTGLKLNGATYDLGAVLHGEVVS